MGRISSTEIRPPPDEEQQRDKMRIEVSLRSRARGHICTHTIGVECLERVQIKCDALRSEPVAGLIALRLEERHDATSFSLRATWRHAFAVVHKGVDTVVDAARHRGQELFEVDAPVVILRIGNGTDREEELADILAPRHRGQTAHDLRRQSAQRAVPLRRLSHGPFRSFGLLGAFRPGQVCHCHRCPYPKTTAGGNERETQRKTQGQQSVLRCAWRMESTD